MISGSFRTKLIGIINFVQQEKQKGQKPSVKMVVFQQQGICSASSFLSWVRVFLGWVTSWWVELSSCWKNLKSQQQISHYLSSSNMFLLINNCCSFLASSAAAIRSLCISSIFCFLRSRAFLSIFVFLQLQSTLKGQSRTFWETRVDGSDFRPESIFKCLYYESKSKIVVQSITPYRVQGFNSVMYLYFPDEGVAPFTLKGLTMVQCSPIIRFVPDVLQQNQQNFLTNH